MKKFLFILLTALFTQSNAAMSQNGRQKVAVYMTGEITNEAYKKVIGSKMVSEIAQSDEYIAVERTADFLKALSTEQDYQTSGEVRDNQIVQIGQKFGVRYVAVVDLSEVFEELFISARLIDVQTGQIDKAYETAGPVESMTQLAELAQDVAGGLILRNGNSVGGGSIYSNKPFPMALAVEKDGKRYYLTPEQWNKMAETKKIHYKKLGLVIIQNGDGFIMSLPTIDRMTYDTANSKYNLPTESQYKIIGYQRQQIHFALQKLNCDEELSSWGKKCFPNKKRLYVEKNTTIGYEVYDWSHDYSTFPAINITPLN